ncbi:uncharacterized protein ATC70_001832 [Mucor velutinosus]|uniref:Choice-of-anchor A domain-containing protein n=1 Tax=Mucor velutinosus TaxID=708070 RepID=A0AAN7DCG9_9FUNG|nr:hypothetical protein ATC70_001832 [Mucor velutinosus]
MVRALSLLLSVLLVSSTTLVGALDGRSRLFFRDVLEDFDECKGVSWENDMLARFTGIFFGDFYTGGSQDILGALAVEGNMHAPNYIVNTNHGSDCSNVNSLDSYGLVVGGHIDTFNTHVHGSAYIAGGGSTEEILQLDDGCFVTSEKDTGIFDFALVKDLLQLSSQNFANHPATVILESDDTITELRDHQLALYEVFTFHTCSTASCSADRDTESDPNAIFFNIGNWNGVQGTELNPAKTYVLNILVTNGGTFELTSNNPSNGFNPCNVILNVYPVEENGNDMPAGEITFLRKSASQLGGFSLAPRAHIVDGSTGNFAGTILGLDYTWENLGAGVEIYAYESAGGNCDQYKGCVPNHVTTTPSPVVPPTQTSITESRTRIWPFTRLPTFKPKRPRTTTETTIITTSVPLTTTSDITTEITTSVPVTLTSDSETITTFSETAETITILTTETTKVVTTTETEVLETISDTTCLEDNTNIVTIDSTKTETFDSITDFVTATEAAHTTTVIVTIDIFITTETDNILSVAEYTTSTRRQLMLRPVTRTKTECNGNICATAIVTGGIETCTDEPYHGHYHGHHHGPGEKCEEGGDGDEDEEDDDEEKKHYHKEGKKES